MSAELIHQMYIAYYQRPADPAGLIYWQDQLNANGGGEAGWNAVYSSGKIIEKIGPILAINNKEILNHHVVKKIN